MAFQAKIWGEAFPWLDAPDYPCPYCKKGKLHPRLKSLNEPPPRNKASSAQSRRQRKLFSGVFDCWECDGIVVALGYAREDSYVVKGFYPPPPIIQISPQTPKPVERELIAAFALFWVDLASCANKLRLSVERTLDALGVPKILNLNQRIKEFENIDPEHAKTFHALREVGNVGSHEGAPTRQTILRAFDIFDHALRNLFDPDKKRVEALRKKIRESKGR